MMLPARLRLPFVCVVLLLAASIARAQPAAPAVPDDLSGGVLEAVVESGSVPFPLLKSDVRIDLRGDLASVVLTQHFANPYDGPMHARYIFPLPPDAAVHAMQLVSGEEVVEARIERREQARAEFEEARERGQQAALLSQQRPNVFTQEVANLVPRAPVTVVIEYAHAVERQAGVYHFHFPMVVGPRFLPKAEPDDGLPPPLEIGRWNLPASPPLAPPDAIDPGRISLHVQLEAGMPIQWVRSPSHPIRIGEVGDGVREISLDGGRTLDNKDFVLRYRLAEDGVSVGVTTHARGEDRFLGLLVEPPASVEDDRVTPREVVFVLDCSGSMSGVPMRASKRFMRRALETLRDGDWFRIIRFSDAATAFSEEPLQATPANLARGLAYVERLRGSGGTMMTSGIRAALDPPTPTGALRLVVFLTDGYIGNDVQIVRLLQRKLGTARLFSFGVGSGVNRYLIQEMARVGRGTATIVLPHEAPEQVAEELAESLRTPVLTDVAIDWGEAPVRDVTPARLPDLFLGRPLRLLARYERAGSYRIAVRGFLAGKPVVLPLDIELPEQGGEQAAALPIVWARTRIEDRMVSYLDPSNGEDTREVLAEEITQLGLRHRLVTQWTSFVAVSRKVVNPGGEGTTRDVAVPKVEGVSDLAYPESSQPSGHPAPGQPGLAPLSVAFAGGHFGGQAAPEPATWAALLALGMAGLAFHRAGRGRRRTDG